MKKTIVIISCMFYMASVMAQENVFITKKLKETYEYVAYYDKNDQFNLSRISYYTVRIKSKDKTMGLCDVDGTLIIPPGKYQSVHYHYVGQLGDKFIRVSNGNKIGFLNYKGDIVFDCGRYDGFQDMGNHFLVHKISKNNIKYGACNKNGKEIIPVIYDNLTNTGGIGFICEKNGNENILNYAGDPYFIGLKLDYVRYDRAKNDIVFEVKGKDTQSYVSTVKTGFIEKYFIPAAKDYMKDYPFSDFARYYVTFKIDQWQKKNELENTTQWKERITGNNREMKIRELVKTAEKIYVEQRKEMLPENISLGAYDADNKSFVIGCTAYEDILISVPTNEAENFKQNFHKMNKKIIYGVNNDVVDIAGVELKYNDKYYTANRESNINYILANINYNFAPIDVAIQGSKQSKEQENISTVGISVGLADIDINIPINNLVNNKTFAVIISNENYQRESMVQYANNDGLIFKEYCLKTLGLPEKNIHHIMDATLNNIRAEINWMEKISEAYGKDASIIFYYAGHGIPDDASRAAYLLPVDGYGSDVTTGYKLDDLYSTLGNLPAKKIMVFLDACFSGAQRDGKMLASTRGVAIKANPCTPSGNVIVFSAAQNDETAHPLEEENHGMFTYYLLKKIQETKGDVTFEELSNYVITNVKQQSVIHKGKMQTPTIVPADKMSDLWKRMNLY